LSKEIKGKGAGGKKKKQGRPNLGWGERGVAERKETYAREGRNPDVLKGHDRKMGKRKTRCWEEGKTVRERKKTG